MPIMLCALQACKCCIVGQGTGKSLWLHRRPALPSDEAQKQVLTVANAAISKAAAAFHGVMRLTLQDWDQMGSKTPVGLLRHLMW